MNKKIFFVIWGNPKFYQTLISLSKNFSDKNYKVFILAKNTKKKLDITENVDFGKNGKILYNPLHSKYLPNILNFFMFIIYSVFFYLNKKPTHTILFNQHSLFIIPFIKFFRKKNDKIIYHNFDFDFFSNLKTIREKLLSLCEVYLSRFCNYLVFPTTKRANLFQKISKDNKKKFLEFKNCFPKSFSIKKSDKFERFLRYNNLLNKKIICHLGTISPGHFIENTIKSARYIKKNSVIIIAGTSINNYAYDLNKMIKKFNLTNKVFIIENVKNSLWFEILFKSDLGICFYENTNLSHQHMSGTSQKFNNYVFANIPMIVNNNKDFLQFKSNFDIFDVVDPKNPKKIGKSINSLLTDKARYYKIKKNLKISFSKELNFEKQFKQSYGVFL